MDIIQGFYGGDEDYPVTVLATYDGKYNSVLKDNCDFKADY